MAGAMSSLPSMDEHGRIPTLLLLARLGRVGRAELLAFRDAQLRRLVRHAYDRVPLYRRQFDDHGVRPEDIRTSDDLPRLPLTTREELQALPLSDRLARGADPERLITRHTSGSSGRPMVLYRTWAEVQIAMAIRLRALHDLGARPSDRRAHIVPVPQAPHPRNRRRPQRALMALGVFPKIDLEVREGLPVIVEALCRWRPDLLLGHASVLARLAALLTDELRAVLRPRLIISGAEALTPLMRQQIVDGFRAEVRDWYGANEMGLMGWECARTGLFHLAEHGVVLEVLGAGGPAAVGEAGRIAATGLHGFAMPFVRYLVGDIVVRGPEPCPCGAPFATIAAIDGRVWDTLPLANGRVVHPSTLMRIVATLGRGWVQQFQFVQDRSDRVVLRVIPSAAPSTEDLARMRKAACDVLGPGTGLEIQLVDHIESEASGKFRVSRALARGEAESWTPPGPRA
jgi:phenylacetate-CoA ligase